MLRENETSRVGAVLVHARAGDRAAMIRAALKWLKPAWDQLVKRRATWLTRIKLTMF